MLSRKIKDYLTETLGLSVEVTSWSGKESLPYYLQDGYAFDLLELLGANYLVMRTADSRDVPLADIRKHIEKVTAATGMPTLFALESLASYERRRLIDYKIPFIVPGNQMYLPELGIDLREYFRTQRKPVSKPLSPSTQAILIAALLRPWTGKLHPNDVAAGLGYTAMTASRALKEISGTGLATIIEGGRERWLEISLPPAELWKQLAPVLRSPVKRTLWAMPQPVLSDAARIAGLSALAGASMLAEPRYPVYAISQEQWKTAQQRGVEELPEPEAGSCEWQIWRYLPAIQVDRAMVDPLSLLLSFRDGKDERIESALDELGKQLPW